MRTASLFIFAMLSLTSCRTMEYRQSCLNEYISIVSTDTEYEVIRSAARDTVAHWAILHLQYYDAIDRMDWMIDSTVIFNEDKNRALLLLLKIDKSKKAKLDYLTLMAAERLEGEWHFYVQNMINTYVSRERNTGGRPHTFKELSNIGKELHIRDGYFKRGTCIVNNNFVDYWFQMPLAKLHQSFLKKRVEKCLLHDH